MSAGSKQIKGRIKSIKNTKKVTKAMELVAGAKTRRSVERAVQTRAYAVIAWDIASRIAKSKSITREDYLQNFFSQQPAKPNEKVLLVAFASNRGLCGAYNSNVAKKIVEFTKAQGKDNVQVIVVGKRLVAALSAYGVNVIQAYEKNDGAQDDTSVNNVANYVYEEFKAGKLDRVMIAYTHYVSSLVQKAIVRPLFPFDPERSVLSFVEELAHEAKKDQIIEKPYSLDYVHDPSKRKVLSYLVPRLGELQLYQALLESNAAEHSARRLAMKSATDAAADMLSDLVLQYNRVRQAGITKEIAEISAGMAAVT